MLLMNCAGEAIFVLGLLAAVLAACALCRLRCETSAIALLYSMASMIGTLFPLPLALLTTTLLALGIACGAAQSAPGIVGIALCVTAVAGLLVFVTRQFASRAPLEQALMQALPDSADDVIPATVNGWQMLRPLNIRRSDVERIRDLSYGPHGERSLLDIYRSRERSSTRLMPVLIQVHGSAWMFGNKNQQALPLIYHVTMRGWLVVSINYRLSPAARFPAHLDDVNLAIEWVQKNIAQYSGDPNFICLTGGSAGGHLISLAALAATRREINSPIKAAVPIYGRYDFLARDASPTVQKSFISFLTRYIMPGSPDAMPVLWELASPVSQTHERAPPFFIVQGDHDSVVPPQGAQIFADKLRAASHTTVAYAALPGIQHGFDIVRSPVTGFTIHAVHRFLDAQHRQYVSVAPMAGATAEEKK